MSNDKAHVFVTSIADPDTKARSELLGRIKKLTHRNILGVRCKTPAQRGGIWLTQERQNRGAFEKGRKGDWCEVLMVADDCTILTPKIFADLRKENRVFMMFPVTGDGRHFVAYGITVVNESMMEAQPDKSYPPMDAFVMLRKRT